MELSDEQYERARVWFHDHGINVCSCAHSDEHPYDLALDMYSLRAAKGHATIPVLAVTCPDCARTGLYNAKVMGLVE